MHLGGDIVPVYYRCVSVFVIIAKVCLFGVSNGLFVIVVSVE